jgi:hypothetical protein
MELATIKNSIHEIRGKKVILDYELAELYGMETKRLKESVRRNLKRFPSDFMIELTQEEWANLRTQFTTSRWGGKRYPPFAFTEQGVAMLSSVLNSDRAIEVNINMMRAFVMMRQWALTYQELAERIESIEKQHGQRFDDIEQVLKYLMQQDTQSIQQKQRKQVGYRIK